MYDCFDDILHGIIISDPEGVIIYWNSACEKIFGYKKDEIVGQSSEILYDDVNKDFSFREILKQFKVGQPYSGQWRGRHKNGSAVWLDVRSKILKDVYGLETVYMSSVFDIKPLIIAEENLEENQALTRAILETSVDAIITIDGNGEILSFNKAAVKMFGYSRSEVVGKNISILMPQPYRKKHDQYIQNYLDTGQKKIIGIGREVTAKKKDGTVFPIDLSVTEVKWGNERVFSGIIKDISEKKKLVKRVLEISDDERRRVGRELHDGLGQLLSGIRMVTENIARKLKARGVPGADEVLEIVGMIKEADQQARAISHGMIHLELEHKGLFLSLQNLCSRAEKMFDITCNISIVDCPLIDKYLLVLTFYRIAQEALNNAVKHGKAKNIHMRLTKTDGHISLIVDDDGRGFKKNFKIEESDGMGIQIMKYRAGLWGGSLDVSRTATDKTRVYCQVPEEALKYS